MNIDRLKEQLEREAEELNDKINFEYRDIIRMDPETKKEKTDIIRKRNEILEQIKVIDTYNRKKYKFDENRYAELKDYDNESLLKEAIKVKFEADYAGGRKYMEMIAVYEKMRNEFGWRIQNSIDVIKRKRYCMDYDLSRLFVEEGKSEYDSIVSLCNESYQIAKHDEFIELLDGSKKMMNCYIVRFDERPVAGIIFDNMYNIRAMIVEENFRCCGIGTKLLYKVREDAKRNRKNVKLYALPQHASYFLLKNSFMVDLDEEDQYGMEIFVSEDIAEMNNNQSYDENELITF